MTSIMIFVALMSQGNAAACRTRGWTGGSTATLRQIKMALDRRPRAEVVQLAWGEMLKKDQRRSLALPTLQYLQGTEPAPKVRGYYKALAVAMTGGRAAGAAIKAWPARTPASRPPYSLDQLCALYQKAGGT